jgi:hypothetical protein
MNTLLQWILDGIRIIMRQLRHIEHKQDILLQHLGAQLPPELVQAGVDLATKAKTLQAALDAQASQPITKE